MSLWHWINFSSYTSQTCNYCKCLLLYHGWPSQVLQLQTPLLNYVDAWLYYTLGGTVEGFLFKMYFMWTATSHKIAKLKIRKKISCVFNTFDCNSGTHGLAGRMSSCLLLEWHNRIKGPVLNRLCVQCCLVQFFSYWVPASKAALFYGKLRVSLRM